MAFSITNTTYFLDLYLEKELNLSIESIRKATPLTKN